MQHIRAPGSLPDRQAPLICTGFLLLSSPLKKEMRKKEKLLSATRGVARVGQVIWPPRAAQPKGRQNERKNGYFTRKKCFSAPNKF